MKDLDNRLLNEVYEEHMELMIYTAQENNRSLSDEEISRIDFTKKYLKNNYHNVYSFYKDKMNSAELKNDIFTTKDKYEFMFRSIILNINLLKNVKDKKNVVIKDPNPDEKNIFDIWVDYVGGDDTKQNPTGTLVAIINDRGYKLLKTLDEYKKRE